MKPMLAPAAAVMCLVVALSGCSTATPDFSGQVSIGAGRELYVHCQGTGSPTVVFISGTGGGADEWMVVTDSGGPTGPPTPSAQSVFDTLARTTRVCAYDRPGTTLDSGTMSPSTLVAQPTTALQGVNDLESLLRSRDEAGPYVLVGASWGGMIAQLFARMHPESTSGIVLVDSASAYLKDTFSPEQWSGWMAAIAATRSGSGAESPDYEPSLAELAGAGSAADIPSVVISSDHPWDLQMTEGASTWPAWLSAQDALAGSLKASHISNTNSGHGIQVEQPALVSKEILGVLDEVNAQQ